MGYRSHGAGGTPGGGGHFLVGLIMACTGLYLLLDNIVVSHGFSMGYTLYRVPFAGNWNITGGGLLIPFMFGVAWIFYNARALGLDPGGWFSGRHSAGGPDELEHYASDHVAVEPDHHSGIDRRRIGFVRAVLAVDWIRP